MTEIKKTCVEARELHYYANVRNLLKLLFLILNTILPLSTIYFCFDKTSKYNILLRIKFCKLCTKLVVFYLFTIYTNIFPRAPIIITSTRKLNFRFPRNKKII